MKILAELDRSTKRVLCNIVLDWLIFRPFNQLSLNLQRVISWLNLFLLCLVIMCILLLIGGEHLKTALPISVVAALITSLSFYIISKNYQYICEQINEALTMSDIAERVDKELSLFIRRVMDIKLQLAGSVIYITIIMTALYFIIDNTKYDYSLERFAKYSIVVMVVFSLGQGAYWAVISPLLTRKLSIGTPDELKINRLYPNRTPILVAASKFLSVAALSDAFMVTLCLISLFILRPDLSKNNIIYPLIIVLGGYLLTGWNFLYPQFNLALIVQRAKRSTLHQIRAEINKMYSRLAELNNSDLERLEQIMKLHETVSQTPNTMINFLALRSFIGSIVTPTVVAVIGVIDWKSVLQSLPVKMLFVIIACSYFSVR